MVERLGVVLLIDSSSQLAAVVDEQRAEDYTFMSSVNA